MPGQVTRRRVRVHPTTGQRYKYPYPIYYRSDRRWVRVSRVIRRSVLKTTLTETVKSTTSSSTDVVDSGSVSRRLTGTHQRLSGLLSAAVKQPDPTALRCLVDRHSVDANTELVQPSVAYRRRKTRPLHAAISADRHGLTARVQILLDAGADPNFRDGRGNTPLYLATAASEAPTARLLLARGARPDTVGGRGETALHCAARQGHCELVRALIDHGARQFVEDSDGLMPVHVAAIAGNHHIVEMLCESDRGAVHAATTPHQRTPIHLAARQGHAETVALMADRLGADLSCVDVDGNTPLHSVVVRRHCADRDRDRNSYYACAVELLRHGAAVDTRNAAGQTALALAAKNQFPKIAQLLVASEAEPVSTQLDAGVPPQKQRRIDKKKSSEKLSAKDVENIAERIRKKPAGNVDDEAAGKKFQSENVVPTAYKQRRSSSRTSSASEETSSRDAARPSTDAVRLRKPHTTTSRSGVDNEISTFSVKTKDGAERMCIMLDQKPSPQDVDDRVRSRQSIEVEMKKGRAATKHGSEKKLVSVEIETDESVEVDPKASSETKQPQKTAKTSSQQDAAVKKRDKVKDRQKSSKDRDSFVESREPGSVTTAPQTKQSTQPQAAGDVAHKVRADDSFFDPESGTHEWFGRPGAVSPVALKDIRKLSTPTFRLSNKSPSGFVSEGGGTRGLKLRVAGVVPKAYNRRQKDSARRAFFAARPVAIESIGDADRDDVSHLSMSSMPEIGYEVWERSMQRRQEWSEPLQPVDGKPPKHHGLNVSFSSTVSSPAPPDDKLLIGPYAPPYRSTGPIDVKTDLIEEMLQDDNLSYSYDSMEWHDDEVPGSQFDDSVPRPPPEILDRHRAVDELLRTSPTERQGIEKVDDDQESKPNVKPSEKTFLPREKMEEDRIRKAEMDKAFEEAKKKLTQKSKTSDDAPYNMEDTKKRRTEEPATSAAVRKREEKEHKPEKYITSDKPISKESHEVHFQEEETRTVIYSSTVVSSQSSTTKIQKLSPENFVVTADLSSEESEDDLQAASDKTAAAAAVIPPRTQTTPVKGILKSRSKYDRPHKSTEKDKTAKPTKIPVSKVGTKEAKRKSDGSESFLPTDESQQQVDVDRRIGKRQSSSERFSEEPESTGKRQRQRSDREQSTASEEKAKRRSSGKDRKDKDVSRIPVPDKSTENQSGVQAEIISPEPPELKREDGKYTIDEHQSSLSEHTKEPGSRRRKAADDSRKSTSEAGPQDQHRVVRKDSKKETEDKETTQFPVETQEDVTQRPDSAEKSSLRRKTGSKTTSRSTTEVLHTTETESAVVDKHRAMDSSGQEAKDSHRRKPSDTVKQHSRPSDPDTDKKVNISEKEIDLEYSEEPGSRRRKPHHAAKPSESRSKTRADGQHLDSREPEKPTSKADEEKKTETDLSNKTDKQFAGVRDDQQTTSQDHTADHAAHRRTVKSQDSERRQHKPASKEDTMVSDDRDVKPSHEISQAKKRRKSSKGSRDEAGQKKPDSVAVQSTVDEGMKEPVHRKQTRTRIPSVKESRLVEREADIVITSFEVDSRQVDTFEQTTDRVERLGETVMETKAADDVSERHSYTADDVRSYDVEPGSKRRPHGERRKKKNSTQTPSSETQDDSRRRAATDKDHISSTDEQIHEVVIEQAKDTVARSSEDSELMQRWPKRPIIRPDVWEEAMKDEPLASSDVVYDDVVIPSEDMDVPLVSEYSDKPIIPTAKKEKPQKLLVPRHQRKKRRSPKLQVVKETSVDEEMEERSSSESSSTSEEDEQPKLSESSSSDSSSSDSDQEPPDDLKPLDEGGDYSPSFKEKKDDEKPAQHDSKRPRKRDSGVNEDGKGKRQKETDVDEDFGLNVQASTGVYIQEKDKFKDTAMDEKTEEDEKNLKGDIEETLPTRIRGRKDMKSADPDATKKVLQDRVSKTSSVSKEAEERAVERSSSEEESTSSTSDDDESEKDEEELSAAAAADARHTGPSSNVDTYVHEPTQRRPDRHVLPSHESLHTKHDDEQQPQKEPKQILPPKSLEEEPRPTSAKRQKRQSKTSKAVYLVQEAEQEYNRKHRDGQVDERQPSYEADTQPAQTPRDIDVEESFEEWTSDEDEMKGIKSSPTPPTVSTEETLLRDASKQDEIRTTEQSSLKGRSTDTTTADSIQQDSSKIKETKRVTDRRQTSYQETSFDDVEPESIHAIREITDERKSVDKGKKPKPVSVPSSEDTQKKLENANQELDDEEMFKIQDLKHVGKGRVKKAIHRKPLTDSLFVDPKLTGEQVIAGEDMVEDTTQVVPAHHDLESDEALATGIEQNAENEEKETNLDEVLDAAAEEDNEPKHQKIAPARFDDDTTTVAVETVKVEESTTDDRRINVSKSAEKVKKTTREKKRTEREAKPTTEANQLKFSSEQGEVEDRFSESDHEGHFRPPTVTVPQPQSKYQPRDDDYNSDVDQPDDEPASLTLRQRQITTEDSTERSERKKTKKDSSTKRSKEETKSKKRQPPATETRLSVGSDDQEQFEHITEPPGIVQELDDVHELPMDGERKDQVTRETDLDNLSDAAADGESDIKPNDTSEPAATVKVRESTKDSSMADANKSDEKLTKRMRKKKKVPTATLR